MSFLLESPFRRRNTEVHCRSFHSRTCCRCHSAFLWISVLQAGLRTNPWGYKYVFLALWSRHFRTSLPSTNRNGADARSGMGNSQWFAAGSDLSLRKQFVSHLRFGSSPDRSQWLRQCKDIPRGGSNRKVLAKWNPRHHRRWPGRDLCGDPHKAVVAPPTSGMDR